jgi:hypothetical protein
VFRVVIIHLETLSLEQTIIVVAKILQLLGRLLLALTQKMLLIVVKVGKLILQTNKILIVVILIEEIIYVDLQLLLLIVRQIWHVMEKLQVQVVVMGAGKLTHLINVEKGEK